MDLFNDLPKEIQHIITEYTIETFRLYGTNDAHNESELLACVTLSFMDRYKYIEVSSVRKYLKVIYKENTILGCANSLQDNGIYESYGLTGDYMVNVIMRCAQRIIHTAPHQGKIGLEVYRIFPC